MNINIKAVIEQLESLRNGRNLSMEEMARICKMGSKSTYSEMVRRGSKLNVDYLINASNELGFSLAQFFAQFEKPNGDQLYEPNAQYSKSNNLEARVEKLEALFELLKLSNSIDDFLNKWKDEEPKQ